MFLVGFVVIAAAPSVVRPSVRPTQFALKSSFAPLEQPSNVRRPQRGEPAAPVVCCPLPSSLARSRPWKPCWVLEGGGKAESVGGNGCTFTPFGPAVDRAAKYIEDESMFVEGEIDSISVCRPKWCPPSPVARSSRKVHFSAHSALSTPRPLLVFSPLLSSVR